MAELVLHGTKDLAAVFEGLRVRDFKFDGEFCDRHFSADEHKVDCHTDADGGEDDAEDDGVAGDSAGLPGAGAELVDELDVPEDRAEGDDDPEDHEGDSRPEG